MINGIVILPHVLKNPSYLLAPCHPYIAAHPLHFDMFDGPPIPARLQTTEWKSKSISMIASQFIHPYQQMVPGYIGIQIDRQKACPASTY